MANLPIVFLSAASDDLKNWRDRLHEAFTRAGCHVYTQGHSLSSPTGDVISLLRDDLDKCDFVIHLAGIAYGAEPESPAFPDYPGFRCSYTQFEYYYAHQRAKQVIAFVCSESFPYLHFDERLSAVADAEERRLLQQAHRDRVTNGRFHGTPLEGTVYRPLSRTIPDFNTLVTEVAAAVGKILYWTQDQRAAIEHEIRDMPRQLADELESRGFNTRNEECQPSLVPSVTLNPSAGSPSIQDLKFRYRWLPYLERPHESDALQRFLRCPDPFCWWGLVGDGGCGKSRLAFELVENCLKDENAWEAGFLLSTEGDWLDKGSKGWLPRRQTLVVIDYASQYAGKIRQLLLNLANLHARVVFAPKVRLLFVDRPGELGPLFSDLMPRGRSETDAINAAIRRTLFGQSQQSRPSPVDNLSIEREKGNVLIGAGELLEIGVMPRTRWPEVLEATLRRANGAATPLPPESDETWWSEVGRVTGQGRLLYLQLLGVLFADRPELVAGFTNRSAKEELLKAILNREFELHWPPYFVDTNARGIDGDIFLRHPFFKKVKSAVAFITLTGGLSLPEQFASLQQVVATTDEESEQLLRILPRILHPLATPPNDAFVSDGQPSHHLAPLEPDPIGERLILDVVHGSVPFTSASRGVFLSEETRRWLRAAVAANTGGALEVIKNLVKDFPHHPGAQHWCEALIDLMQGWMDDLERNPDDKTQWPRLDMAAEYTASTWVEFLKMQPAVSQGLVIAMAAQVGRHEAFATRVFKYIMEAIHEESSWEQNYLRLRDFMLLVLNAPGHFQFTFMGVMAIARWAGEFRVHGTLTDKMEWLRLTCEDFADDLWMNSRYAEALPAAMIAFGLANRREDFDCWAKELEGVAARWPNEREIQKQLANGAVNAGAFYGQIRDTAALAGWSSHLSRLISQFSNDVVFLQIISKATSNMSRAYGECQDLQGAQHWLNEHLVARRNFARGVVWAQTRSCEIRDMESVENYSGILEGWANEFPDDPVLQNELVLGLYQSLLAPGEADFQRATPILKKVHTALRRSAMDRSLMNGILAEVYLKTDKPDLSTYRTVLYAYLSIYWPGFVSDVWKPKKALALLVPTRSDDPESDSQHIWLHTQQLAQIVQNSVANGSLPSKEQVLELWQHRMYLEDRGDSLLHTLESLGLEQATAEYHADPWR